MPILIEKEGSWTHFLAPLLAVLAMLALTNVIGVLLVIGIGLITNIDLSSNYNRIFFTLLLNLLIQLSAVVIIIFIIIPLSKSNRPLKTLKTTTSDLNITIMAVAFLTTLTYTLLIIIDYLANLIFPVEPVDPYTDSIIPTAAELSPIMAFLFVVTLAVGAPLFEELLYRRTLIPLMEERGVSPLTSAAIVALLFALTHTPNDLGNFTVANFRYAMTHLLSTFIIGFGMGIAYILTRNIVVPIILHSVNNFIPAILVIATETNNESLIMIIGTALLLLILLGIAVGIYVLMSITKSPQPEWVKYLRQKTLEPIRQGLVFMIVVFVFYLAIEVSLSKIADSLTTVAATLGISAVIAIMTLYLLSRLRYMPKNRPQYHPEPKEIPSLLSKVFMTAPSQKICPSCHTVNPATVDFCTNCSTSMHYVPVSTFSPIITQKQPIVHQCSQCNTINPEQAIYCKECGTKIAIEPKLCPKCNRQNKPIALFCQECGYRFQ